MKFQSAKDQPLSYLPAGIDPWQWTAMSDVSRVLTEAAVYLTRTALPKRLYVERLIDQVDLNDNRIAVDMTRSYSGITRNELKLFLQYLEYFSERSAYVRRVNAAAEKRGMQLSIVEDDASLLMRQSSR
jgi:hypothetical protein